jgi:hypothetical protein
MVGLQNPCSLQPARQTISRTPARERAGNALCLTNDLIESVQLTDGEAGMWHRQRETGIGSEQMHSAVLYGMLAKGEMGRVSKGLFQRVQ